MANDLLGYDLEDWMPTSPLIGPPLPKWMGIEWPWYKEEAPSAPPPSVGAYSCPYCPSSFDTIIELGQHVATVHPDKPPIGEIAIEWE